MFAQSRFSVGIGFGGNDGGFYQPPPAYASNIPPCPGPGYTWVDGYWSQDYGRPVWVAGFWSAPSSFSVGYQFAPRFDNRFRDGDDRRAFTRGGDEDRNRGFDQNRSFNGQSHPQNRGSNPVQTRGRSNGQDHQRNGSANSFRGR